jgi:hypothetical protein
LVGDKGYARTKDDLQKINKNAILIYYIPINQIKKKKTPKIIKRKICHKT